MSHVYIFLLSYPFILLKFWPAVGRPADRPLDEDGGSLLGYAVAVADKDVLTVEVISGAVACCLILLLVTLKEDFSAAVAHVLALRIKKWSFDTTAAAYGHTVVAFRALTTVVPRDEEVVPTVVLEDERGFDGIGACEVGGGVLRRIGIHGERLLAVRIRQVKSASNGARLLASGDVHRRIETDELDTIPERAPDEPRLILIVDDEVRIDGVPVVATFA